MNWKEKLTKNNSILESLYYDSVECSDKIIIDTRSRFAKDIEVFIKGKKLHCVTEIKINTDMLLKEMLK